MSILKTIHSSLSSMRTGIILLAMIGLISAIASTFLTESFFQSSIFKYSLILLLVNMTLCTINQSTRYVKYRPKEEKTKQSPFRQVGVLILHAGVVLILIGGTVNSFNGQTMQIRLFEGDEFDIASAFHHPEPFTIKLDEFKIEFNEDGSPAQYYSHVSLIEGDSVVKPYSISVNYPLNYRGIKAYQQSYGHLVGVQGGSNTGWENERILRERDIFEIEDTDIAVMVFKYIPHYDPQYGMNSKTLRPDNPKVIYSVFQQGAHLWAGMASFGEKVEVQTDTYVQFNGIKPFTVLTVKRDPGLPLAAAGGFMLMLGTCLALFIKKKKQGDAL